MKKESFFTFFCVGIIVTWIALIMLLTPFVGLGWATLIAFSFFLLILILLEL